MTTTETILTRMMNDSAFANAVFADTEKALAGYDYGLSAEEIAKFKAMPRAGFEAITHEERKSFGFQNNHSETDLEVRKSLGFVNNHNETDLEERKSFGFMNNHNETSI